MLPSLKPVIQVHRLGVSSVNEVVNPVQELKMLLKHPVNKLSNRNFLAGYDRSPLVFALTFIKMTLSTVNILTFLISHTTKVRRSTIKLRSKSDFDRGLKFTWPKFVLPGNSASKIWQ